MSGENGRCDKSLVLGRWLGLLLLLAVIAPASFAQTTGSATLRVTVKDQNNAVVSGANVTVTNDQRGDQRQAETNDDGTATFASLDPGAYTLRIESGNFKASEQKLSLNTSDTRGVDVNLEVGTPAETVTVTSDPALIQTETGAKESTLSAEQIDNLSIVSRSSLELLRTLPGVVTNPPGLNPALQSVGFNSGANANNIYNINGLRGENNNVSIDGSRVIDPGSNNGTIITANPDQVQEVKVQTSNFAAEYGSSGVQITATTKGGGRDFRGSVYDYIRNYQFNSLEAQLKNQGLSEKPQETYQFPGGNVGGPVLLPFTDFNRSRDKLFFFFGFEVQRQTVDPGARFSRVPTAEQRNGNNFLNANNNNQAFNLDPTLISPFGRALINLYPLPNLTTSDPRGNNYAFTGLQPINRTQGTLRLDYKISDNTSTYVRLARESETQEYARGLWWNPSAYQLPSNVIGNNLGRSAAVGLTNVINPTMTNEVVFSASKLQLSNDYADPSRVSLDALNITGYNGGPFGLQSPYLPVNLITSWSGQTSGDLMEPGGLPLFANNSSFSATDNLTKIVGSHTLKFGGLIEQVNKEQNAQANPEGQFIYAPWGARSTGDVFADILAGRPAQYVQSTAVPTGSFRLYNVEGYAQDSWKVRPNFTLEYGMRLAFFPSNKELQNLGVMFDPSAYDRTQGLLINGDPQRPNGVRSVARGEIPQGVLENPGPQFAPRVGFAWDVRGNGETVIRGGAGLFYNRVQGNYQYSVLTQAPNVFQATFDAGGFDLSYNNLSTINPYTQLGTVEFNTQTAESNDIPRITSYSVSFAQRLPFRNALEISYVGTQGDRLPQRRNINFVPLGTLLSGRVGNADLSIPVQRAAVAGQAGVLAQYRRFPAYSAVNLYEYAATSSYNSLQASLTRQFGRLSYNANYTFSKALGTTATNETGDLVDPIDPRSRSYGVLPFDRTHLFNLSFNYELPDGARGPLDKLLLRGLLNGWQLSGINTIQSGIPIRLRFSGDIGGAAAAAYFGSDAFSNSNGSSGAIAPTFSANPQQGSGTNLRDRILNLSAIGIPGFGTSGPNQPPFYLRSPGISNSDITFFKNFRFGEERRLQFRAAFFNIFNQSFPRYFGIDNPDNDIETRLIVQCATPLVNGVPNGSGGTSDNVCDPSGGYRFTQGTIDNFGRIQNKRGRRIIELALKFYF